MKCFYLDIIRAIKCSTSDFAASTRQALFLTREAPLVAAKNFRQEKTNYAKHVDCQSYWQGLIFFSERHHRHLQTSNRRARFKTTHSLNLNVY